MPIRFSLPGRKKSSVNLVWTDHGVVMAPRLSFNHSQSVVWLGKNKSRV